MEKLHKEFEGKGVHILAINLKESNLQVETFRDQYGLSFPIAIDRNESVKEAYTIKPLPTTLLINKDGKIEQIITREMSEDEIGPIWRAYDPSKEYIINERNQMSVWP